MDLQLNQQEVVGRIPCLRPVPDRQLVPPRNPRTVDIEIEEPEAWIQGALYDFADINWISDFQAM